MRVRLEIGAVRVRAPAGVELDPRSLEERIRRALADAHAAATPPPGGGKAQLAPEVVTERVADAVRAEVREGWGR